MSVGLLFLMWYCWPAKKGKSQSLNKVMENTEKSRDYYDYDTDGEQRSSSSFTSPSRSASSATENLSKEDLPKPITEPIPSKNLTSDDIATEVEEFLAENTIRKDTIVKECRNFVSDSKSTGGYRRIIAKTMQARKPRAQMFTIDPRRR